MKHIVFYLDFISPYAYLAFERLPIALQGLSYTVEYRPVLFAGVLQHHGQLGPAEIAPKREWTYRQAQWLAHQHDIPLQMPAAHPFNPLGLLRLALACEVMGSPNRYVCETLFRHAWASGQDAADASQLQALTDLLKPKLAADDPAVKARLRSNTDQAIARGVFGVPTLAVDSHLFWGLDALPMLRSFLDGSPWFGTEQWTQVSQIPVGMARPKG